MRMSRKARKAFTLLRREGNIGDMPRSKFDYGSSVGDGLSSSIIVAIALWVSRNFPEAPIIVQDSEGEEIEDHLVTELFRKPNPYYGGGIMRAALALDYTIQGNAYIEIGRSGTTGGMPTELFYQPSLGIEPKGTASELITHYEQQTSTGKIDIPRDDIIHFRNGLDPRDQKKGLAPLQSLLREIFTDDEAANFTAVVLRNFGFPGIVIAPTDKDDLIGEDLKTSIKDYFKRMFTGDKRGEVLVSSGRVNFDTLDVDLNKLNLGALRNIPEERATAVTGIPAAVVGFGSGLEQTKVGATMSQLRELAYENAIVPMQRAFAEELNSTILPEFDTDKRRRIVFDMSEVRVLQEDENQLSERITRQWQSGLITRAEGRRTLGYSAEEGVDEVYRQGFSDVLIPADQSIEETDDDVNEEVDDEKTLPDWVLKAVDTKSYDDRVLLVQKLLADFETLSRIWSDELRKEFTENAIRIANVWSEEAPKQIGAVLDVNGNTKAPGDPEQIDRQIIDRILLQFPVEAPQYEKHYLRVLQSTSKLLDDALGLGVMLDEPLERAVIAEGGTRRGLIDMNEQTRSAMYDAVAQARSEGLGPPATARRIRDGIESGPFNSRDTRALVIARTETKWAQNVSSMEIYEKASSVEQVQVFDAQLGDTDAACVDINGRIMSVREARIIDPIEHPNCTRSFAPIVNTQVEVTNGA